MINRKVFVALLLLSANPLAAQVFLSPGIKLGYRFGPDGGLVGGFDVSVIHATNHGYVGLVAAIDLVQSTLNSHVGFEAGVGPVGICIGPVLSFRDREFDYGARITPYFGAFLVPFYNFQIMRYFPNGHEIGAYLKIPVTFGGDTPFGSIGG